MIILGISSYYHDAAAALIIDGEIIAAAQEERFTRKRHDSSFPVEAVKYCLKEASIGLLEVDKILFYEDPELKFARLKQTYKDFFPASISLFLQTFWPWYTKKRHWKKVLQKEFSDHFKIQIGEDKLVNVEHHLSHAASAYLPSPFNEAAILIMDGVGEFATTSIWKGKGNKIELLEKINFPNSIGLLYSAFTYYTGFKVNSGEYKVMGLAPYGQPLYVDLIKKHLVKIDNNGLYSLNMDYFSFAYSNYMTNEKFHKLFGGEPRTPESLVTQKEMDIARSLQDVTEEIVLNLAKRALEKCGSENLCMAGGVALNCVANGKILSNNITSNLWIQPAAGDAGGALGAALYYYYSFLDNPLSEKKGKDTMKGSYLGPSFTTVQAKQELDEFSAKYHEFTFSEVAEIISQKIADGNVIGWFQGRMEFGPRALGNRSIIGDARNSEMQKIMNLKIKFRESFRPFAPAVTDNKVSEYFKLNTTSPYMLIVAEIQDSLKLDIDDSKFFGIDKLNLIRSKIPAVTHVDYSARVQTVHEDTNPEFYMLLNNFSAKVESSVLINTSFNVRGEPIVCSVSDAYQCFMRTEIDVLVINDLILYKSEQPDFMDTENWQEKYEFD